MLPGTVGLKLEAKAFHDRMNRIGRIRDDEMADGQCGRDLNKLREIGHGILNPMFHPLPGRRIEVSEGSGYSFSNATNGEIAAYAREIVESIDALHKWEDKSNAIRRKYSL